MLENSKNPEIKEQSSIMEPFHMDPKVYKKEIQQRNNADIMCEPLEARHLVAIPKNKIKSKKVPRQRIDSIKKVIPFAVKKKKTTQGSPGESKK